MKSIETEGKTVAEAIDKACQELNASPDDLVIEVLSNASAGFLGLGTKKAQVRATLKEKPVETGPGPSLSTSSDPAAVTAKKTLENLLGLLEIEAQVSLKEEDENIYLNIAGNGSGLLIGRKGQTLDALEYLVNKIVHKAVNERKHIVVDTENYRSRREESLVELARRLSEKAKKMNKPVTISPMNAHDRRIIHLALQDDKNLRTWSTGTGLYRKLVISPEKKNS